MRRLLFDARAVQAILNGTKTAERKVIKPQPETSATEDIEKLSPYHRGDILYVAEPWMKSNIIGPDKYLYKADYNLNVKPYCNWKWRPPAYMSKEAARIFLTLTDVHIEKLQNITDNEALAEGVPDYGSFLVDSVYCPVCKGEGLIGTHHPLTLGYMEMGCPYCDTPRKRYANRWNSKVKDRDLGVYGWNADPYVVVISFEVKVIEVKQKELG